VSARKKTLKRLGAVSGLKHATDSRHATKPSDHANPGEFVCPVLEPAPRRIIKDNRKDLNGGAKHLVLCLRKLSSDTGGDRNCAISNAVASHYNADSRPSWETLPTEISSNSTPI
jgi:hypothetical protein